jgi:Kef-type K+ transport system membrane component KefB/voltage-gated potassium channel Kch
MALENIFFELGLVIIIAGIMAGLATMLRQPLIIAYVITGLIIGPMSGLVSSDEILKLSELGIAFLLFLVGLEMDIRKLKNMGAASLLTGIEALYLGLALSFSSTMIIIKILSDKQELDTLHGRMLVGILLVEDAVAIFALTLITHIGDISFAIVAETLFKGVLLFVVALFAARYAIPKLMRAFARSQEMLFLSSISWCFAMAMYAHYLGYSIAIGSFLAGLTLASQSYSLEISSRVKSLRDFFAIVFFVSLGMQILFESPKETLTIGILLSLFVLLINPIVVMTLMSLLGYKQKVSFHTSMGVTQISEFSLILIALGVSLNHLNKEALAMTSIVAIITIIWTPYMMKYNSELYYLLKKPLSIFSKIEAKHNGIEEDNNEVKPQMILCGQDRIGYSILRKAKQLGKKMLIVDYNPDIIKELIDEKVPCVYGDVGDSDVIEKLNMENLEMIISTVPDHRASRMIIIKTKEKNKHAIIIVTSDNIEEALTLYQEGADYVIMPHLIGGDHASVLLDHFQNLSSILDTRMKHISELHKRRHEIRGGVVRGA